MSDLWIGISVLIMLVIGVVLDFLIIREIVRAIKKFITIEDKIAANSSGRES